MLTPDVMKNLCEETSSIYKENEDIRKQYEELFDGDLMQNRERFLCKKRIFSVNEIGQATINVPMTAKMDAKQVENSRDNIKEGEEVGDGN